MQLMRRMKEIFNNIGLNIYLRPYDILVTSNSTGFIEFVPDTLSIDQLKKKFPKDGSTWTLKTFYEKYFRDGFDDA